MAEALTNHLAQERGIVLKALSAGTVVGQAINPTVVAALDEIGVSLEGHRPKPLTPELVNQADRIISMGCGVDAQACPTRLIVTEDWGLDDPAGQPLERVREIRDQIVARVNDLIEEINHANITRSN
jgi:protein-tyrosine-phosphatase